MSQKELAARLDKPAQAISEIIHARKAITPDTALGLEKVLGVAAHFWNNLEADYRMTLARNRNKAMLAAEAEWLDHYPVTEMIRRGWLRAGRDRLSRVEALLGFMGVASAEPRAYQNAVGFRITESSQHSVSPGALAVWLRKGELDAQAISTADYDERSFRDALSRIRGMTRTSPQEFLPAMSSLCAESGVAFCVVQEFPKSGANGATRWLTGRKALIQMSIRNRWADIFWFTFFHEAYHLLQHRTQRRIVVDGLAPDPDMLESEMEADKFSRDFLIGSDEWNNFCLNNHFTAESVTEFAKSVGVAPFIVVGRLQKEKRISYNQLTSLKTRYQWVSTANS